MKNETIESHERPPQPVSERCSQRLREEAKGTPGGRVYLAEWWEIIENHLCLAAGVPHHRASPTWTWATCS